MTSPVESPTRPRVVALVKNFLQRHVPTGSTIVVGVSGGPDSVCLLHAVAAVRRDLGITARIAHLNHRLRGEESDQDERFVIDLALRLGVEITIGGEDTRSYQRRSHRSLEDAARQLRHRFFAEIVDETGAVGVLLAHTADDQAETVLLRVIRGTGPRGLAGIRERTELRVTPGDTDATVARLVLLRPLLAVSRGDVLEYVREAGLTFREDSTNGQPIALRNRVRNRLLPLMERENPRIREALVRLADATAVESDFLELQVDRLWPVATEPAREGLILRGPELLAAPRAVRRRLLLRAIERVAGEASGNGVAMASVDRVEEALSQVAGSEVHVPGARAIVEYQRIRLEARRGPARPTPVIDGEVPIAIPGVTSAGPWLIRARVETGATPTGDRDGGRWVAAFDLDRLGAPIVVRTRRPGDRFVPTGMAEPKKLQDYFVDAKVPQRRRDRVPIVAGTAGIAWIVGHRQDARFAPNEDTVRTLVLSFEPVEEA